ncbi:hypothetical protein M885DRAFT_507273 [Pelagophyceae sp. CCMP2097]|nr:hypothetical protein M885DRAFT_507273 [Pelagophyceae sp. CCMP2097]|mmetsp:Transcript_4008/g.14020  ORF Transcript_4008/g.14020 Transcript_4008/m.14020 type:complete len:127 (+) Transcript_4008:74-454(+)
MAYVSGKLVGEALGRFSGESSRVLNLQINLQAGRHQHADKLIKQMRVFFHDHCARVRAIPLPKREKLFTVKKSPHVNGKCMEQYSIRTFKRAVFLDEVHVNVLKRFFDEVTCKGCALRIMYKSGLP